METLPTLRRDTSFTDAVDLHTLDCRARRLSPRTLEVYARNLTLFQRFAGDLPLTSISPALLRRFLIHLEERGLASVSAHQAMRCLRAFFNFCVAEELLIQSPMRTVRMPKVPQKILEALTSAQLTAVLGACATPRDRALVLVLVASGVRAAEACALHIDDADLNAGTLHVRRGKGAKGRLACIDTAARKALKHYLLTRKGAPPGAPLFVALNAYEKRITPHTVAQIFTRLQRATGIHVTAHGLRRTFALRALRAGMNVHTLALLMGHSDISVLRRYLPITEHDAAAEYQRLFG